MRALVLSCLLVLPLFAGCLGGEDGETPGATPTVARTAEDAGAVGGPAPVAPKEPYQVTTGEDGADPQSGGRAATVTAYPVPIDTNPAKPPVVLDFSGEFHPLACGTGLSLNVPMGPRAWQWNDFRDALAVGDVFSYTVEMRYTNTESNWADLHLFFGLDGQSGQWTDPTGETRGEVVMNFTGQSYRTDDDASAWAAAGCWYGAFTEPIPYTLTVTLSFAESAVPAGAPMLLKVPEGATRLFIRGLPLDPAEGVNSHWRVFAPDDALLCECALNSNQETGAFALPGPGDYVLLVDHTSNGFVSVALDAAPPSPLRPLQAEWVRYAVVSGEGGPVDKTVTVELPSTPLLLGAWMAPPGLQEGRTDVGVGKAFSTTVTNGRGEVIRLKLAGFAAYRAVVPGQLWMSQWFGLPFPDGEWEFVNDHHAYAPGAHSVHVKADALRGDVFLNALHYVRP